MPDKQPPNTSVAVRRAAYNTVIEISKMPHLQAEGRPVPNLIDVMDEIIYFYQKAHQKGRK